MSKAKRRWLVLGAAGMLGRDFMYALERAEVEAEGIDIEDVDIRSRKSVRSALEIFKPDLTINLAAFTDVDGCESNEKQAFEVNAVGPENIAAVCSEMGSNMLHISTEYVFNGKLERPYREDDGEDPLSVYGKSKALGDSHVRRILPDAHCIVRTQWLFGAHGKNFVDTIISLARDRDELTVVNDQHGSPTWTVDLAEALIVLGKMEARGTYHVTNSGSATWHEFAVQAVARSGITGVQVSPMSTEQLGRPAPRPLHAILDNTKYNKLTGASLPSWKSALKRYLDMKLRI